MATNLTIRLASVADVDALLLVEEDSFPVTVRATEHDIFRLINAFPRGQFIAVECSSILGVLYTKRISDMNIEADNGPISQSRKTDLYGDYIQIIAMNIPVIWTNDNKDDEKRERVMHELMNHALREFRMDRSIKKIVTITGNSGAFSDWKKYSYSTESTIIPSSSGGVSPKTYVLEGTLVYGDNFAVNGNRDDFESFYEENNMNCMDDSTEVSNSDILKYEIRFNKFIVHVCGTQNAGGINRKSTAVSTVFCF